MFVSTTAHQRLLGAGLALAASTALLFGAPSTALAVGPNAIQYLPGCTDSSLARNDDGSTGSVALGFTLDFFGATYSNAYVNNNGNITFDFPMSTYTPFPISTTGTRLIAPFFGDVDTRNAGSDLVRYGQTTYSGRRAFCVNWAGIGVGYYSAQVDKLNHFQLILVDRSDVGRGDFDMIFNYDQVQWEAGQASGGTNGLGGSSARAGYSNGTTAGSYEFPGSAVNGYFLDSAATGLVYTSRNSTQPGRYIFTVRNGIPPTGAALTGFVYTPTGAPSAGSPVGACRVLPSGLRTGCVSLFTDANGHYVLSGLVAGTYQIGAMPNAGSVWLPTTATYVTVTGNELIGQDLYLGTPSAIPVGTTLSPSNMGGGGVPTTYWGNTLNLATNGCAGATAAYTVVGDTGLFASGPMTESPSGHYTAAIPPFYPNHGYATIHMTLTCPNGSTGGADFNIYIDPSGRIIDTHGNPVVGATVTLLRSDSELGPFTAVPNGSAIMSPSNRVNPMPSTEEGAYGWDVMAGYYIVHAEAEGCTDPTDTSRTFVESSVLTIPPPVTGLDLVMDCGGGADTQAPLINVPASVSAEATGAYGAVVDYLVTALDNLDGEVVADCTPTSGSTFALGASVVTCTASDAAGNVATATFTVDVVDTTAPELALSPNLSVIASSSAGNIVSFANAASDVVSGALDVTCSPASGSVFPVGTTVVSCSASDDAGNTTTGSFHVSVVFDWSGILAPINANGSSVFKAGSTIPVKFQLSGSSAGIGDATAALMVAQVSGAVIGTEVEATSTAAATTGNLFRYDAAAHQYIFNWSTKGWSQGTYQLHIVLADGVSRTALISLKQ